MDTTVYTLFMPPQNHFGDFGMFCGFTASSDVLRSIRKVFAGESSRPMLAAFIHPTNNPISDIPGLAWMWIRPENWRSKLLHAKVALLGFRASDGDGYVVRLVVSTGNWTLDPLTNSIDLFWTVDLDTKSPDPQATADLRAAWSMFDWLRDRADCSLIARDYDGLRPDARLADAIVALPPSALPPRFIDSRAQALFPQVVEKIGFTVKGDQLTLGSGYFESEGDGTAGLPERLRKALVDQKLLQRNAGLDLFLNPQSCQGLAKRASELAKAGWTLRPAKSVLHGNQARLHAKFVMLSKGDDKVKGRLYLGSGNLSKAGFETAVTKGGNLEAGVVVDLPDGLFWQGKNSMERLLPIQFEKTVALEALNKGEDFEVPEQVSSIPPITWLIWEEGHLKAPENANVDVISWDQSIQKTPCLWPLPAPVIVTLAETGWRIPVLAEGVLVTPRPPEMTVEDVLAGLRAFPEPADRDQADDGFEGGEPLADAARAPEPPPATYAIRRMMELLVRLGQCQQKVDPRDWARWCRELRQNLCAITGQEDPMIGFFCKSHTNPLPVLLDPRMQPKGVDCALLEQSLMEVAHAWGLARHPSLWSAEDACQ